MILFAKDWARYPTAFPDLTTKNKSFLRLASVYREMGIKNHAFLLALVNPDLQGIDPFDPDLPEETQQLIAVECFINPWYYFREIARVPESGSPEAVQLEANRANIALFWCFFNHIMIFLLQPRQTGKSLNVDELMAYLLNIVCRSTSINLLTKDDKLRNANVRRLKAIMDELPFYLGMRTKDDVNNTEQITVNMHSNVYNTHVAQSSVKAAYNQGRGLTSPVFQIDEAAFQKFIKTALGTALGGLGAAVDAAKRSGTPYGVIVTTTAGKVDDRDSQYIYKLVHEAACFTERFFDCADEAELEQIVRANSRKGVYRINATFSHRQLGKTDEWLQQKIEESTQDGDDVLRDFYNVWTTGTASHPLGLETLKKIVDSRMPEKHSEISPPYGYITRWYIPEDQIAARMRDGKFIVSMDTSEAGGNDDISMTMIDIETFDVVAAGTYNETNLFTFSEWVADQIVKYENTTWIIERRSTGAFLIDYLLRILPTRGVDPFKRLFNWGVDQFEEYRERFDKDINIPMGRRHPDLYVRLKKEFGFATSASGATSRSELYGTTLTRAAKNGGSKCHDRTLVNQISGLINKNGRIDHQEGNHDDMVIGWLLGHWFLNNAKNLSFYGIDSRRIGCSAVVKKNETNYEKYNAWQQYQLRQRLEEISIQLGREQDDFIVDKLEKEARHLDRELVLQDNETFSLDDLINRGREQRRNKRKVARDGLGYMHTATYQPMGNYMPGGQFSNRPMTSRELMGMRR